MLELFTFMEREITMIERIVDVDGSIIEKPYTSEQLAENEKAKLKLEAMIEATNQAAAAKAALLEKLVLS
jgi:glycerol kinase